MKKLFKFSITLILLCLPFVSHAQFSPSIILNTPNCMAIDAGNLTTCFQNKTQRNLQNYNLMVTALYDDGSFTNSLLDLTAAQSNFFSVMSTSSLDLKKNKITSLSFSIIKGDGFRYSIMPGCTVEYTPTSVSKSLLEIYKTGDALYCK